MKKLLSVIALVLMLTAGHSLAAPVDINTASAAALAENLTGIGLSKAQAIVEYRTQNGAFKHADELVNIKGIGLKTVEKNLQNIKVSPPKNEKKS